MAVFLHQESRPFSGIGTPKWRCSWWNSFFWVFSGFGSPQNGGVPFGCSFEHQKMGTLKKHTPRGGSRTFALDIAGWTRISQTCALDIPGWTRIRRFVSELVQNPCRAPYQCNNGGLLKQIDLSGQTIGSTSSAGSKEMPCFSPAPGFPIFPLNRID